MNRYNQVAHKQEMTLCHNCHLANGDYTIPRSIPISEMLECEKKGGRASERPEGQLRELSKFLLQNNE